MYTAKYLLKALGDSVRIDVMDKLPTCYGLVRYGVAPDHPEVKAVSNDFDEVMGDGRVNFFGNVELGVDVSLDSLRSVYDGVVLAYGASTDRLLNVPGEDTATNVWGGRNFVNWYNGHPDCYTESSIQPLLDHETAIVVGLGNVALDVARILTRPVEELAWTDIASPALDALRNSKVKRVVVVGRRGTAQASFTIKELRELSKLPDVGCLINPQDIKDSRTSASVEEIKSSRGLTRIDKLIGEIAAKYEENLSKPKQIELKFLRSPLELIVGSDSRISKVTFQLNQLEGKSFSQTAVPVPGSLENMDCGLLVRSIGYKSEPISGVAFDSNRHVLLNSAGRVNDTTDVYASGWLKRGPTGIVGTNINDARETVDSIVSDFKSRQSFKNSSVDLRSLVTCQIIDWNGYQKINQEEMKRGSQGTPPRPREKLLKKQEMIDIATK